MEAAGLAFSVAQTLLAALSYPPLQQMFRMWGYQSELESLESTVSTVSAVLLDAQSVDEEKLSNCERDLIEKLKDAVYDADDLLDEFATLAKREDQLCIQGNEKSHAKVQHLFSRYKKLKVAYSMSGKVQKIRKKLDQIANDAKFRFIKVDRQPIRKREETYAYVNENSIVGRDVDKDKIVNMLLDPSILGDVPVLAIVGMGGLGKTALAQLVYNHERIQAEFHKRRFWVCVSDQDQNQFNIKAILAKIYKLAKDEKNIGDLELDPLVRELRNVLVQNKYLLVLDDVWAEDRIKCNELLDILIGSGHVANKGSRIVVTTRSKKTAAAMRCNHPYELQGLSDEDSWLLFKITSGMKQENLHELVKMGKDIVRKCANVPLAIKVVGSSLYGQNEDTWRCIQQHGLSATRKDEDNIIPILKFSYNQLSPSLKSCFIYSAIFPKDTILEKGILTSLWIAQDYVKDEGQGIEAAAEYYFNILVQRCFFQDVADYGDDGIITFKIHDLMHDMAHQAAGKEIFIAGSTTSNLGKHIRHLFDAAPRKHAKGFITKSKIRSYIKDDEDTSNSIRFPLNALLTNWRSLRVLDLAKLCITELPNAIGELLHLRVLDLSGNEELKKLPESFTKLINLQTLLLHRCNKLEELPEDFTQLINLRTLHVSYREEGGLRYMPSDMEKMTCLISLNKFIVSQRKSSTKREARLGHLRVPRTLKGCLKICISPSYKHSKGYGGGGGYLCNTEHLNAISIKWPHGQHEEGREGNDDDDVLEDLQPHSNLKVLEIKRYPRLRIPRWAREDGLAASLPNLVKIVLEDCDGLKELPWLGKLQHLKTLQLLWLRNLEYIEHKERGAIEITESSIFFASLETLFLNGLEKLKGWWRGSSGSGMRDGQIVSIDGSVQTASDQQFPLFPRLSKVYMINCHNLRSIPLGPVVKTLVLRDSVIIEEEEDQMVMSRSSSNDCGNRRSYEPKIEKIRTNRVRLLMSLPVVAFQCLTKMTIEDDDMVESLSEVEEVFRGSSSSLRFLTVTRCSKMRSISRGLQHLTALESLELIDLPELRFDETQGQEEEEEEMPWRCLAQCLRTLKLCRLRKVFNLPKGMRCLTALQSLDIEKLPLKDVPEWIGCLPSLHSLKITRCEHLESLPKALRSITSLINDLS